VLSTFGAVEEVMIAQRQQIQPHAMRSLLRGNGREGGVEYVSEIVCESLLTEGEEGAVHVKVRLAECSTPFKNVPYGSILGARGDFELQDNLLKGHYIVKAVIDEFCIAL